MDKTHFIGFFLRILRILLHLEFPSNSQILLHLKQLSHKTKQRKRSENLPFSRNLFMTDRKRQGQGGVMWTEYHNRWDANHIAWINLIRSNTTHCAKLGFMRLQESYIDCIIGIAQVAAPGLYGGFSFRGSKKLKGGDSCIHSKERTQ